MDLDDGISLPAYLMPGHICKMSHHASRSVQGALSTSAAWGRVSLGYFVLCVDGRSS